MLRIVLYSLLGKLGFSKIIYRSSGNWILLKKCFFLKIYFFRIIIKNLHLVLLFWSFNFPYFLNLAIKIFRPFTKFRIFDQRSSSQVKLCERCTKIQKFEFAQLRKSEKTLCNFYLHLFFDQMLYVRFSNLTGCL